MACGLSLFRKLSLVLFLGIKVALADVSDAFQARTSEFGISNLGIGYSNIFGFQFHASTRYQYFILDRIALGGMAFYDNFNRREWMGLGPSASWIAATYHNWFLRLDQHVTTARYTGFVRDLSQLYGTTSIGIAHVPYRSNYYIGAAFAHTYALDGRDVFRPNTIQILLGWFWN
jgi:hypothetical protein